MTTLFGFGQAIDTTLAVPGAIVGNSVAMAKDYIRIRMAAEAANEDAPLYTRHDDALVFNAPNIATYRCEPNHIEVSPCPRADAEWVIGLLLATALPATLWMQGKFVLHAAGIVPKGSNHAIAIAGPNGAGKSHLAAQLLEQGACLLGDDSLALEVTDAGISASGMPGGIHTRIGHSEKRRFEPVAPDRSVVSAPLGAIIVLGCCAGEFESVALNKLVAVEQIIANQHRPRIPAALARLGPVLAQAAAIAEQVPVNIWRRRNDQIALSPSEHKALMAMMR
jgi:hypothetical protein